MFEVPASIFVSAERPDIKDIQDLNGKRIAMQAGDYAEEFLKSRNFEFDVVTTKNFAEATNLVISGKADALIGDEQIVLYHIFKNNLVEEIKKVGDPLYVGRNCMATRGGNALLAGILDKGITAAS
ncbi:MAG: transporter substrate-binding domain-containing protein [Deltaproteobacteria bacterium]|nr:transporter substrate-binding domain-containing protein [Deltaproteobacteria bacterium]